MNRYVCIHGHFYQPPRENPWLEEIELQDSAYPYHDWNDRINVECYAANALSRILDDDDRIVKIVNNYSGISFNFGPTLLAWMADKAPDTYRRIIEADDLSRERFSGHGSAMAQAYNHMILPLASERDKRLQVQWGVADFRRHFCRRTPRRTSRHVVTVPGIDDRSEVAVERGRIHVEPVHVRLPDEHRSCTTDALNEDRIRGRDVVFQEA
jgi:alpha-amylase/alpha-mannosidase (GH57 family)